jgi:peptidoglycan/LPS O-acetylase OafA/YrhL
MRRYSELRMPLRTRWGIGALALVAMTTVLVILDHWAHAGERTVLLGALVMACVVMHLFLHGSPGGSGGAGKGPK